MCNGGGNRFSYCLAARPASRELRAQIRNTDHVSHNTTGLGGKTLLSSKKTMRRLSAYTIPAVLLLLSTTHTLGNAHYLADWYPQAVALLEASAKITSEPQHANETFAGAIGAVGGFAAGTYMGMRSDNMATMLLAPLAGGYAGEKLGKEYGKTVDMAGLALDKQGKALECMQADWDALVKYLGENDIRDNDVKAELRAISKEKEKLYAELLDWKKKLNSKALNRKAAVQILNNTPDKRIVVVMERMHEADQAAQSQYDYTPLSGCGK